MEPPGVITERNGTVKAFAETIWKRRASQHFSEEKVPEEDVEAILAMAGQAPSGFNLQPWRFVVVRDPENRQKLSEAANGQEKVNEAPVVVVAFADREDWKTRADEILKTAADRGARDDDDLQKAKESAFGFVDKIPIEVWLNRHVMIAVTYMMLGAETLGWDTAPMEGFDPEAVQEVLSLPASTVVVAILAIGRRKGPEQPHPGRLAVESISYQERHGLSWSPVQTDLIPVKS